MPTRSCRSRRRFDPAHRVRHMLEAFENRQLLSAALPTATPMDVPAADVAMLLRGLSGAGTEVYPALDGTGNNVDNPQWGAANTALIRVAAPDYADGVASPAGAERPSAREISNIVAAQSESATNDRGLTNLLWLWGQFIDHDLDLSGSGDPAEAFDIKVPTGDPHFDPFATGTQVISFTRSDYDPGTGDSAANPRQQINQITAFLDGSMIYGSDETRAAALRTFSGGKLKTSDGDLLPFNTEGFDNAGGPSASLFLAGDVRANENVALTAMHTVWVREHNRIADQLAAANSDLTDEEIFSQARAMVIAGIQIITYNEFLPALLGVDAIAPYRGYNPDVDPSIANVFSTAAYRFGHSLLPSTLPRLGTDGHTIDDGDLALRDAFFNPAEVSEEGIDSILRGLASSLAQELDNQVIDDVRNFLFGPPGAGGFDLVSLNIQRGRDHGLPSYNDTRIQFGLDPVTSFADISSDPEVQARLGAAYGSVDDIDLWVGALAEDHLPGTSTGELIRTVLVDQFTRIRDGDRYWYQNVYRGQTLRQLERTTLAQVIQRNTDIVGLQNNVFFEPATMVVQLPDTRTPSISLVSDGKQVSVINARNRQLIASAAMSDLARVMISGGGRALDIVTIDVRQFDMQIEGPIVVDLGAGPLDRIRLLTGRGADEIDVTGNVLTVNGQAIEFHQVERIDIVTVGRGDAIDVDDGVETRVVVQGPGRRSMLREPGVRAGDAAGDPAANPQDQPQGRQPNARPASPPSGNRTGNLAQLLAGIGDGGPARTNPAMTTTVVQSDVGLTPASLLAGADRLREINVGDHSEPHLGSTF